MVGNNWMDDRERRIREREGRGLSDDRAPDYRSSDYRSRYEEDRTWDSDERPDPYATRSPYAANRGGRDRDRVFGERDTGAGYNNRGWQDRAYRGVSPAMQRGDYRRRMRPVSEAYRRAEELDDGGRYYGDDGRERVYSEIYGEVSYDDDYSPSRARYHAEGYGEPGYGQAGDRGWRGETDRRRDHEEFSRRVERAGRQAGAFLRRTGEQVADWFNAGGEGAAYGDLYAYPPSRGQSREGHQGRGPQGYRRADERISEDAHERLTDDPWLDASNIAVMVASGEVTLSGTVEHREAKHRAERVVEDISGVTHVQNNLRVAKGAFLTSPGRGYGDSVLGAQIRKAEVSGETPPPASNGGKRT